MFAHTHKHAHRNTPRNVQTHTYTQTQTSTHAHRPQLAHPTPIHYIHVPSLAAHYETTFDTILLYYIKIKVLLCHIKGNVAGYKGLFLELPSGHVIAYTYTKTFTSAVSSLLYLLTVSLGTHEPLLVQEQVPHIISTKKDGQPT